MALEMSQTGVRNMTTAKTLNPLTSAQRLAYEHKTKGVAIELASMQAEVLRTNWYKNKALSHTALQRLVQAVLRLGGFTTMDEGATERLVEKFKVAANNAETHVEHYGLDGRIYLTGYYDIRKLHRTMLW
jgi:hypothetical protein